MPTSERLIDRGRRRGRYLRIELGRELRECRLLASISQAKLARAVGVHQTTIGRIERGELVSVSLQRLAECFALLGHELWARSYVFGPSIRDAGQVRLLTRGRERCGGPWQWRYEVRVGGSDDPRAWDAVISAGGTSVLFEAETRLRDVQALLRRLDGKLQDAGGRHLVLLVADTRSNREAVRAAQEILRSAFPISAAAALAALRDGRDPGGNALILA